MKLNATQESAVGCLMATLDFDSWVSLARLRKVSYPTTLEDKKQLLINLIVK